MDWIDNTVAVGSLLDAEEVLTLIRHDIDLVIDARLCFNHLQPIPDTIFKTAKLLCFLSDLHTRTLIHCVWGIDRTPFLAMAYYARKTGLSYQDAYVYIKLRHPSTIFHWDWVEEIKSAKAIL